MTSDMGSQEQAPMVEPPPPAMSELDWARRTEALTLDNTRLRAETERLAQELNTMTEIGREISATLDLATVLERLAARARQLLRAQDVVVRLLEADGRLSAAVAVGKYAPIYKEWEGHLGRGLSGSVAQTGRAEIINTPEADPRVITVAGIDQDPAQRALLVAPLLLGEAVIGVLSVWRDKASAGPFTPADLEFGVGLARQAAIAIQNARLYTEAQHRARETEVLRAANVALTQTFDPDAILGTLLDYLQQVVPYDTGSVFLMEDEHHLTAVATRGYEQWVSNPAQAIGVRFEFTNMAHIRAVVADQTTFVIPDVTQFPGWIVAETASHVRNWLAVPLVAAGQTIGMYSLDKVEPGFFTPEHRRLAEALATQAAIAIQNANLFQSQQVAREQAETLTAAAQALSSTLSRRQVFEVILSELRKVVPYDSCSVQQLDGDHMVIVGGHGFPNLDELLGNRFDWRGPDDPAGEVVRRHEPVIIADVSARFAHFRDETHGHGRVHGWMGVPLLFGERLIGMLTLDKLEEAFYTADHARLARAFATQAAIAIENARLFDETQLRLAETQAAQHVTETLFAITQVLAKTVNLRDIFEVILSELQQVVPYDSSSVQVIQDNRLVIVGGRGFEDLQALLGVSFDLDDETNPSVQVVRTKRQQVFGDVSRHPHFMSQIHGGGRIRGWIGAPLIFGDRVIGVITLDKFEPDFYNDHLAELALAFAAQAATAIENARLFETERLARQQAEALSAAAQALSSTLSLRQVFDLILSELRKMVPYDSCSVQQLDGDTMVIVGGHGFPNLDELLGNRFDWRGPDDPAGDVVRRREPVIIADVSARFEHFKDETHGHGRVHGWMGVPLLFGERLIGMLTLDKLEEAFYTADHARMAQAFATQAATAIENARLFETERLAREQSETLRAAAQALSSTLSLRQVFEIILSELRKVVPYDSCSVQQLDGDMMVIVGGQGFPNLDELLGNRFDWRGPDDPAGAVVRGRAPVIIADVSARFEHFKDETHGQGRVHGWMGVPLLFGERLTGMLTLDKLEANFYTPDHAHVALAFATQAATAIENARLFGETQRLLKETNERNAELSVINSVQAALAAELSLQGIYDAVGDKIREIFHQADIGIGIYDAATDLIHYPYLYEHGQRVAVDSQRVGERGLAAQVLRTRETLVISADSARAADLYGGSRWAGAAQPQAQVLVPLATGDQARGLIDLADWQHAQAFSESDVRLLQTLANAMSVALENARLFDETQRLLRITEDRAAELGAIGRVSQALLAEAELESTIQLIGSQVQDIFRADSAYVALLDPDTHLLRYPYQTGQGFTPLPLAEGPTRQIVQTGEPVLIRPALDEGDGATHGGRENTSYLGVPLKTNKGIIGVIGVQNSVPAASFTDDSLRLLTTIAANAGAAVQNAQLFSEALENLRQVEILTNAASAIEQSAYEPAMVESVARRTDALGELARVFRKMADEVRLREQRLKRQLQQLQLDIEEKQLAKAETVAVYLPMDRRQALAAGRRLPEHTTGAAVFADVSGFTALTEALANELGLQRGAEEVIRQLNRVYTALIDEVHRYGGSVINFSGDAITCWFDALDALGAPHPSGPAERAAACGLAMQTAMRAFAVITRPDGKTISLSIKVAVAAGPARRLLVGEGTAHQIDVLAGHTLSALSNAEHHAERGEVIVAAAGIAGLAETLSVAEWRDGEHAVITGLRQAVAPAPWAALAPEAIPPSQAQPWMLPAVYEKVRAGQSDMLSELREVAALFLKFGGLEYDADPQAGTRLDAFIAWVERVIAPHHGAIIQLTVGDKGSYLYVVFGAPSAHPDDAAQAVLAALDLAAPPAHLADITNLQIGLAYGQMRVGAYGGSAHRTYGAIGDKTNLAARLMQAATPALFATAGATGAAILCDDAIYAAAQTQVAFEALSPIRVKGKAQPIPVYRPLCPLSAVRAGAELAPAQAQVFDRLSPAEQLTLKVASVIGQHFTLAAVSAVYPEAHEAADLDTYLRHLAALGLISPSAGEAAGYAFQDAPTHAAAYNLMLFAQRRQLHRAVAELIEQTNPSHPPYAEIAHHWRAADEIPKAVHYLELAGEQARATGDYAAATRFFNEALALNS